MKKTSVRFLPILLVVLSATPAKANQVKEEHANAEVNQTEESANLSDYAKKPEAEERVVNVKEKSGKELTRAKKRKKLKNRYRSLRDKNKRKVLAKKKRKKPYKRRRSRGKDRPAS